MHFNSCRAQRGVKLEELFSVPKFILYWLLNMLPQGTQRYPFGIRNYVDKMTNFNERLSLQWNDFKDNVSSAFGDFCSATMNMIR